MAWLNQQSQNDQISLIENLHVTQRHKEGGEVDGCATHITNISSFDSVNNIENVLSVDPLNQ